MSNNRPMTITEIAAMAAPLIELPPFEEGGQPLFVRAKKPDIMGLVKAGKIPNELLGMSMQALEPEKMAEAMLSGEKDAEKALKEALQLLDIMMENTLVSPKWHDPVEGLDCEFKDILTDEQQNALLAYAGGGVKALATFRQGPGEPAKTRRGRKSVGKVTEQLPA